MNKIADIEKAIIEEGYPTQGETAVKLWQGTASMYSDWPIADSIKLMNRLGYEIWHGYPLKRKSYFLTGKL